VNKQVNAEQAGNALVLKMDALNHTPHRMREESNETTVKDKEEQHDPSLIAGGHTKCMYLCMLYNCKFLVTGEHYGDS